MLTTEIIKNITSKGLFTKEEIITLLSADEEIISPLFAKAAEIKTKYVGNFVYFRGLIELSNICSKNCFYCGIRRENHNVKRYRLTEEEILTSARYIYEHGFGSLVLQSGERSDAEFISWINDIVQKIIKECNHDIGITLSLGEQTAETYRQWYESGAYRYLLRIETTNKDLFYKIHPNDANHQFEYRMNSLYALQNAGYQTGTGVMIGLPFQTTEDLAEDILFMQNFDIDMIGMGPYIEHEETPLYEFRNQLWPIKKRMDLTIRMIAILRILMKDINIAATTALQAIDPLGREKGLRAGANVMMPNITPINYHGLYILYKNKPVVSEDTIQYVAALEKNILAAGDQIAYGKRGDPKHFFTRNNP